VRERSRRSRPRRPPPSRSRGGVGGEDRSKSAFDGLLHGLPRRRRAEPQPPLPRGRATAQPYMACLTAADALILEYQPCRGSRTQLFRTEYEGSMPREHYACLAEKPLDDPVWTAEPLQALTGVLPPPDRWRATAVEMKRSIWQPMCW